MRTSEPRISDLFARTIKGLAMDAVQRANSGHPGMPMGMADATAVLWAHVLRHDPSDPRWVDRDRFVLSAGHGCMLLYSVLHLTGYRSMTLEQIKNFRQWGSLTPGHPESHITPGVETTTGPLGQGFATGVGFAIAERMLAERFNRNGFPLVGHYTYGIVSDGDLMEGVAAEAASLAGHLKLGRLIYLYDDNRISIDGSTGITFTENVDRRFEAYGWHVQAVNGHDHDAVKRALDSARAVEDRPSLIRCETRIAKGAPTLEGSAKSHGSPLGHAEIAGTKEAMDWPQEPFYVPEALRTWSHQRQQELAASRTQWDQIWGEYRVAHPDLAAEFTRVMAGDLPVGLGAAIPDFATGSSMASRKASGTVINALAPVLPELVGGSADLAGSNNTTISGGGDVQAESFAGRNFHFGVREHAMGAIANGLSLHGGFIPFVGTFLQFSDYMRPSVRLAALMGVRAIYVWTHDSIFLGEDGPTHQPVEHLSALRAMPNLSVFRPADAREVAECWLLAVERSHGPSALALSRQNLPTLAETESRQADIRRGGYVLWQSAQDTPEVVLLATGSEVSLALDAAKQLAEADGRSVRVVSLPCWEVFDAQTEEWRQTILGPVGALRVVVEAGVRHGWDRYAGQRAAFVTLDTFGHSAPDHVLAEKLGFTTENVVAVVRRHLGA